MSWVNTIELAEERTCNQREDGHRTYTRVFKVLFNDLADGPVSARLATGIPRIMENYAAGNDYDNACRCSGVQVDVEAPFCYRVTAEYNSDVKKYENPLDEPDKISVRFEKVEVSIYKDLAGLPIVNSAGDPFEEQPTIEITRPIIVVSRSFAYNNFNYDLLVSYQHAINDATWNGFGARTVKFSCDGVNLSECVVQENPLRYWAVDLCFAIQSGDPMIDWRLRPCDIGWREFYAPLTKPKNMTDEDGEEIQAPRLLDGTGHALADGDPAFLLGPFTVAAEKDFSVFNVTLPF